MHRYLRNNRKKMQVLEKILVEISYFIVLLPLLAGLLFFKKLNLDSKWIFFLSLAAAIPHILTALGYSQAQRNIIFNSYTFIEFVLYYFLFKDKYIHLLSKNVFKVSVAIFILISVGFVLKNGLQNTFLNLWVCIANLMYLFWLMLLIRESIVEDIPIFQRAVPFTYYALGVIVYACTSMLVMSFYNRLLTETTSSLQNLWLFHDAANIFIYSMFLVGLLVDYYTKQPLKKPTTTNHE